MGRSQKINRRLTELRISTYGSAGVKTIHERHHDIKDDKVRLESFDFFKGIEPVVRLHDFIFGLQSLPYDGDDIWLIVNYHNSPF